MRLLRYDYIGSGSIFAIGKAFAFFALTTSFVPLALSFFDFLADGLKIEKVGIKKVGLVLVVFGVPTFFALIYPHIFLVALGYAGGISCALLFGLMPPIMAWVGRYIKRYDANSRQLSGGRTHAYRVDGFCYSNFDWRSGSTTLGCVMSKWDFGLG